MPLLDDIENKLLRLSDNYPSFAENNRCLIIQIKDSIMQTANKSVFINPVDVALSSKKILDCLASILVEPNKTLYLSAQTIRITLNDLNPIHVDQFKTIILEGYAQLITQITDLIRNDVSFEAFYQEQKAIVDEINKVDAEANPYSAKANKIVHIINKNTFNILPNKNLANLVRAIEAEKMFQAINCCLQRYKITSANEDFQSLLQNFLNAEIMTHEKTQVLYRCNLF